MTDKVLIIRVIFDKLINYMLNISITVYSTVLKQLLIDKEITWKPIFPFMKLRYIHDIQIEFDSIPLLFNQGNLERWANKMPWTTWTDQMGIVRCIWPWKVNLKQRVSNGLQFLGFRGEIFTTWLNHLDYISWMIQHLKLITWHHH